MSPGIRVPVLLNTLILVFRSILQRKTSPSVTSSSNDSFIAGMVYVEINSAVLSDTYGSYELPSTGGGRKIAGNVYLIKVVYEPFQV